MAVLGLSTVGVLSVWFGAHDPSAPVPAVASAASALMLVGLLLGSPLVVWVSAHALRRTASDPAHFRLLHRAVRRRTWGFVSTAALGATALEVSRAGVHRMPSYLAGSWGSGTFDPQSYLPALLHRQGAYGRNYDEKAEAWIEKCMAINDVAARLQELQALEAYFHEQCPFIWLHAQPNTYAMAPDIDFKARADELMPVHTIKKTA